MHYKVIFSFICAAVVLTGCTTSNEDFWTAETCNTRIESDVVDFTEYQEEFAKVKKQMETDARSGNAKSAEANKKNAENRIQATASLLAFIDGNILPVCKGKIRADLLEKVDAARKFAQDAKLNAVEAEDMPDVRVTGIQSTFVPYELDDKGACSGPYLNLVITITNQGADFPRSVDLETYVGRAQQPAEKLDFFMLRGELDFGEGMRKSVDIQVYGDKGRLAKGATLELPAKIRVDYNQKKAHAWAKIEPAAFLKIGNDGARYETDIDVPIWDIYTVSHMVVQGKDEDDGKTYIGAKATVTNLGSSPTPGPIEGSFIIKDIETGRQVESWSGKTTGPVSGNTDLYSKIPYAGKLPAKIEVISSIIPLCPDGNAGALSDGDPKNNIRTLQQQGI